MTMQQFGSLEAALANGIRLLPVDPESAAEQARSILSEDEQNRDALRLLSSALRRLGREEEADQAALEAIKAASNEPALVGAARAIRAGDLKAAEHLVRPFLSRNPDDPAALRLLAEIAAQVGALDDAEKMLRRAIELAPVYASAHLKLAKVLFDKGDFPGAIGQLDHLLAVNPEHGRARSTKAATLVRVGEYDEAIALYEQLIARTPEKPDLWISYGHILNTVGRFPDAVAAYRRAVDLRPAQGEAWFYLSNLKTSRFTDDDVAAMLSTLERDDIDDDARLQLYFALGKAFEDAADYAKAFEHYAAGNRIRADQLKYDPGEMHSLVRASERTFTREFFGEREAAGSKNPDPIFVLGLPRAGSTLVEQILSSHSMIEGTSELPYIPAIRQQLSAGSPDEYPAALARLSHPELAALGTRYLASARANRKTDRPFFIDKLPNNWENLGLILTILPNAKIVDARRHPMACGFSNFKQHFARGQAFTYSLKSIGRYYADYVRMLDHFDQLLPGRIHRVIHEQLVEDPEQEIKRLLDYLGVPFEESCLRFYENDRAVRTPSAEQVRQPLNREGLERWKAFDPWLGELREVLGPLVDDYPG